MEATCGDFEPFGVRCFVVSLINPKILSEYLYFV